MVRELRNVGASVRARLLARLLPAMPTLDNAAGERARGGQARPHIDTLPGAHSPDAFLFERYAEGRGAYGLTECRHTVRERARLGRLLGHRKPRTTARYAHLARHSAKTVANRIADSLVADMRAFTDNLHKA